MTNTIPVVMKRWEKIPITQLVYDVSNRRVTWANNFRPYTSEQTFETAMERFSNVKNLMSDIRVNGVLTDLIVAPFEKRDGRWMYRVYGGNTRLLSCRKINRVAEARGENPPILELPCIVYELPMIEKNADKILYADHQMPPKRWPLVQRVLNTAHLNEHGRSLDEIADEMMLASKGEAQTFITASRMFYAYLEASGLDLIAESSKISFFVEAAKTPWIREVQGAEDNFVKWMAHGLFISAFRDIRNLSRIIKNKMGGYEWASKFLDRDTSFADVLAELTVKETNLFGIR